MQWSICDELQGDWSGDETLGRMLDITSQTFKVAKMTSFSSDFQTLINH